ncbi:MAG: hypothetical protein AAF551_06330 [Bacteroidota bacterium]
MLGLLIVVLASCGEDVVAPNESVELNGVMETDPPFLKPTTFEEPTYLDGFELGQNLWNGLYTGSVGPTTKNRNLMSSTINHANENGWVEYAVGIKEGWARAEMDELPDPDPFGDVNDLEDYVESFE